MRRQLSRAGRRGLISLAAMLIGTALPVALPASLPAAHAATPSTQTPVMGPSMLTATQLAAWYHHKHSGLAQIPALNNHVVELAQIFIDQGRAYGVRGDIAFAQSMLETAWLSFPSNGQIPATFNNYAGLFAFNGRAHGTTCAAETSPSRCFSSPAVGVQYQIQLLRGYADASSVNLPMHIRPPSDRIGIAPYWERFGGSQSPIVWATAPNYGTYILGMYDDALAYSGVNVGCLPYYSGGAGRVTGNGYWLFGRDGATYPIGSAPDLGNATNRAIGTAVDAAATPSRTGYWMLGADGGIYAFGAAGWQGSTHYLHLVAPVDSLSASAGGRGYLVGASDGGVFAFGDAPFYGSLGGQALPFPIVSIERSADGKGYWLLARDGGVYHFGDALWMGSARKLNLSVPFVDMTRSAGGHGYYLLQSDGTVRAYGDAVHYGDLSGCGPKATSSARLAVTPTGKGYWIVSSTGSVAAFGDARQLGMPATTNGIAAFAFQS